MTDVLDAALAFHHAGICVIPAAATGTKQPWPDGPRWKQYQAARPTEQQLQAWFASQYTGLGIVCGQVSGGIDMLEFEGRAVTEGYFEQARIVAEAAGIGGTWRKLTSGYMEFSPSGGLHFPYRLDGLPVPPNTKLAERPAFDRELTDRERADVADRFTRGIEYWPKRTLMETRGEGGFTVVAPSHGPVHPTGKPWLLPHGSITTIPVLTAAEHKELYRVIRSLDQMPAPAAPPPFAQPGHPARQLADGELKPGEDWNRRTDWAEILKPIGWAHVSTSGTVRSWRRDGKNKGISATTGRAPHDNLYVFSTSTEFPDLEPISKFRAYAILNHGGDDRAAARALRAKDYGTPPAIPAIKPPAAAAPQFQQPAGARPAPGGEPGGEEQPRRSSWHPIDLTAILDGDASGDPLPAQLARTDGQKLLYAGKVNGLIGESESGKTWVALAAVTQALADSDHVVYLDFEDSAAGIVGRLRALGSRRDDIAKLFHYAAPDEPFTVAAAIDVSETLAAHAPALAVVDGVNAAMALLGLNLKDNKDATDFSQRVLRPLKRTGATVLTIDHVTKSKDDRGSYAIGAQAKRADIDGAAIIVEAVRKFGRGQEGKLRLTVSKDRPGHVRAISSGAEYAGMVTLTSAADGTVTVTIAAPDMRSAAEKPPWRPTGFMERISRILEDTPAGMNTRAINTAVTGKAKDINDAVARLRAEGYVTVEHGLRGALVHRSARSYREATDDYDATVSHRFPTVSPDPGKQSSAGPDDRFPEAPIAPEALGDREAVDRTAGQDTLTPATVSRNTGHCSRCGELLPHQGRPCQDPGTAP